MQIEQLINNYTNVLKKYTVFSGRATRAEYWYFVLVNLVITILINMYSNTLGSFYSLAVLLPGIGVSIRRLHDINKSGWMLLVSFIPLAGLIWLIILMATEGDKTKNNYGPKPKTMK